MFICECLSVHDNEGLCDCPGERASWVPFGNLVELMYLTSPNPLSYPDLHSKWHMEYLLSYLGCLFDLSCHRLWKDYQITNDIFPSLT